MKSFKTTTTIGLLLLVTVLLTTLVIGCSDAIITPTHVDPLTGLVIPASTNYASNHIATEAISGVQVIVPFIPAPWNGILLALGGIGTAVAGAFATYKNKQVNDHASMLGATVAAIEQANNPTLKANVQTLAAAAGVGDKLDEIVQDITG